MIEYLIHGAPKAVAAIVKEQANVIGPRIVDGVAYANIRTDDVLKLPVGVSVTGPELSTAMLGVWA
jgi:hypothetical protein